MARGVATWPHRRGAAAAAVFRRALVASAVLGLVASAVLGLVGCTGQPPAPTSSSEVEAPAPGDGAAPDTPTEVDGPEVSRVDVPVELDAPSVDDMDAAPPADVGETQDAASPPPPGGCGTARRDGWIPLPEASGAVPLADGRLLVVADSGHGGAGLLVDPTGVRESVAVVLPLDGPTHAETGQPTDDDLEGLDLLPDGRLVALTSAGWLRMYTIDGDAFTADGPSYALSDDPRFFCANRAVNCGPNYEGLCLRPAPSEGRCDGYAASKASGELVCLVLGDHGALTVDPTRVLATGVPKDELSDCAFVPGLRADGSAEILLAGNLYSGSAVWRFDEVTGEATRTGVVGAGNQEAIVHLGQGLWWSLGDLQGLSDESPWQAFSCVDD